MVEELIVSWLVKGLCKLGASVILNVKIEHNSANNTEITLLGKEVRLDQLTITNCTFLTEDGTIVPVTPHSHIKIVKYL